MVLLQLLLKSNHPHFEVAHVNYGLRGEESDEDELLVKTFCNEQNLKLHLLKVSESVWSDDGSIQMIARDTRYKWFESLLQKNGLDKVVTAHHANDNFETVLYNLAKGTGISGLRGILNKSENRVRPLLYLQKRELIAYAEGEGLDWREDASNKKNDYARNKIRNQAIPVLEEVNSNLIGTFQNTRKRLLGLEQLQNQELDRIRNDYLTKDGGKDVLSLSWYQKDFASELLLAELLKTYGLSFDMVDQLQETIRSSQPGKVFYTSTHQLNFDRGQLIIQEIGSEKPNQSVLAGGPGTYQIAENVEIEIIESSRKQEIVKDTAIAILDAQKVKYPIVFRPWQEGDAFQPLGMKGKKKLSDFLIDQKVSLSEKQEVIVVLSNDVICWLVGMRIDHRFRVTDKTEKTIQLLLKTNS